MFVLAAISVLVYWQFRDLENIRLLVRDQLETLTDRKVEIGAIEFDLSVGVGLRLHRLVLTDPENPQEHFRAEEAGVTMGLWSLIRQDAQIQAVSFRGAKLIVTRKGRREWGIEGLGTLHTDQMDPGGRLSENWKRVKRLDLLDTTIVLFDPWITEKVPVRLVAENVNASLSKTILQTALLFSLEGRLKGPGSQHAPFRMNGRWHETEDTVGSPRLKGKFQLVEGHLPLFSNYLDQVFSFQPVEQSISTETDFTWDPAREVECQGKILLARAHAPIGEGRFELPQHSDGQIDFDVRVQPDSVKFRQLDYRSGDFRFDFKGSYSGFAGDNPQVQVEVSSSPFRVDRTRDLLPFKLFFAKTHEAFHERFRQGMLEIRSFQFSGSLDQLNHLAERENLKRVRAELLLHKVDFGPRFPKMEAVSGGLILTPENNGINISEARYEDFSISGLSGNVSNVMTDPVVAWTVDGQFKLGELKGMLRRIMDTRYFEELLEFFRDLKGEGSVHLHLRGPLKEPEKLEIEGAMELENASFQQAQLNKPFENIQGRIRFTNHPDNPMLKTGDGPPPWEVKLEGFSGTLGPHQITELAGETTLEKGSPVRRVYGKVKLGLLEAAELVSSSLLGKLENFLRDVTFSGGEVLLDFRGEGPTFSLDPSGPIGLVELKKVTLQHKAGYRPLIDVSGILFFDENKIRVETREAWYGDSPVEIKGQYLFMDSKNPELVLRASSSEFEPEDFTDIPFLETLEYDGHAKMEFIWQSNDQYRKFENHVDLTGVDYHYGDWLIKPKGVPNRIAAAGRVLPKGGIDLNELVFELAGNRVTGHARVEQPSNPQFSAHLEAENFKTLPMAPYVPALLSNRGGAVNLSLDGQGNVRRLEDAVYRGQASLNQLEFQPDGFIKSFLLDGDLKWTGPDFSITNGRLELEKSRTRFEGRFFAGPAPRIELKLRGDAIYLKDFFPEPGSKEDLELPGWWRTSKLLNRGSGSLDIELDRFKYKHWNLRELKGQVEFRNQTFDFKNFAVGTEARDRIEAQGSLSLRDPKRIEFDGLVLANHIRAEGLLGIFGPVFDGSLNGHLNWFKAKLNSRGSNLNEAFSNLNGDLAFDLAKGQLQTYRLRHGVNRLFEFTGDIDPEKLKMPLTPFVDIFGEFVVKNGIARTENFQFEEPDQRMSLVGDFNMGTFEMDTVVGVSPLRELDRFLTKIPVVGKIITAGDEESLFKNYYTVKGSFSRPEVNTIPFTSLGKKVVGIFQGILQSPGDLIPDNIPAPE